MTEPDVETTGKSEEVTQRLASEHLKHEVLIDQINNKTKIPFESITQQEKTGHKVSEIIDEIKKGNWNKAIEIAFAIFLNGENEVKGLGFFAQGIEEIDQKKKVGIFNELEKINDSKIDWKKKMKISLLKAEIEYSLYKKGYNKGENLKWNGEKGKKIEKGKKLQDYVDSSVWKKIQTQMVLGALSYEDELPEGAYLFFDKEGYPIFISNEENPLNVPSVQIFEKVADERKNETKVDFLQKNLKVGDVLFLNERSDVQNPFKRFFVNFGRVLQAGSEAEEKFPAIHVAVVTDIDKNGEVYISHIRGDGGHAKDSLRERVQNKYSSVSVGRLGDVQKANDFAKRANDFAKKYEGKGYGFGKIATLAPTLWMRKNENNDGKSLSSGLLNRAMKVFGNQRQSKEGQGVICWDTVKKSSEEESDLSKAETALKMFETMDIVYSMSF